MSFEDISFLELWQPFCSVEQIHLCNFGKGYYEEQFCEIILNLDQWFRRRCLLKIVLIWSFGGPFVQQSGTSSGERNHLCNFGRGYQEEHYFEFGRVVQEMLFKHISYEELWCPFVRENGTISNFLCNFGRGHYEEQFYEFI